MIRKNGMNNGMEWVNEICYPLSCGYGIRRVSTEKNLILFCDRTKNNDHTEK